MLYLLSLYSKTSGQIAGSKRTQHMAMEGDRARDPDRPFTKHLLEEERPHKMCICPLTAGTHGPVLRFRELSVEGCILSGNMESGLCLWILSLAHHQE